MPLYKVSKNTTCQTGNQIDVHMQNLFDKKIKNTLLIITWNQLFTPDDMVHTFM